MSSVSQLVSRLQDTHFPSDVDKLFAQLGHLDSLSAVPDTLMLDDDLHGTAVNMGFTAADMPIAIDGIMRGHSVSKNWKTGPLFQFNLDDEASMKATAEAHALSLRTRRCPRKNTRSWPKSRHTRRKAPPTPEARESAGTSPWL